MQLILGTSTAALLLLFGTMVPAYAQQDRNRDTRGRPEKQQQRVQQRERPQQKQTARQPRQQERRQQQRQQPQRQPDRRSEQAARPQQQSRRTQQQAAAWQQQRGWLREGGWRGAATWRQGRAQKWEREHRTWSQRGGYGGYYIPQGSFSLYFGNQHWFRMSSRPSIYMGYPRFSHRGFSFMLLDPWPEYWSDNWYEADEVYIDYEDGYYLYNRRHPTAKLAITVVL